MEGWSSAANLAGVGVARGLHLDVLQDLIQVQQLIPEHLHHCGERDLPCTHDTAGTPVHSTTPRPVPNACRQCQRQCYMLNRAICFSLACKAREANRRESCKHTCMQEWLALIGDIVL